MKIIGIVLSVVLAIIIAKAVWVYIATRNIGSFDTEKTELLQRRNYLLQKINVEPQALIDEMPSQIGPQFQGEWAIYSLSMLTFSLHNLALLYPETRQESISYMDSLISKAMSAEIRLYDKVRWYGEDPLESLDGDNSHMSYISILAWMISNYKDIGGNDKYDSLYHQLCEALNRRMLASPTLNLPTYPCEYIYTPDMFVAIVALSNYAKQNNGMYQTTVDAWLTKARTEWIDPQTGLIRSYLEEMPTTAMDSLSDTNDLPPVVGAYSALNCSYLALIDDEFAREQYRLLKKNYLQTYPIAGIKEYHNKRCWFGFNYDAGPILLNLSPSGTAFALGAATYFGDNEIRTAFLKTAELAGTTISYNGKKHYWLADIALVGEAITLAMRTMKMAHGYP